MRRGQLESDRLDGREKHGGGRARVILGCRDGARNVVRRSIGLSGTTPLSCRPCRRCDPPTSRSTSSGGREARRVPDPPALARPARAARCLAAGHGQTRVARAWPHRGDARDARGDRALAEALVGARDPDDVLRRGRRRDRCAAAVRRRGRAAGSGDALERARRLGVRDRARGGAEGIVGVAAPGPRGGEARRCSGAGRWPGRSRSWERRWRRTR